MCGLGFQELLVIFAIVLLLFGASRLPQLGKALGETVRNFKKGSAENGDAASLPQKRESLELHVRGEIVENSKQNIAPAEKKQTPET